MTNTYYLNISANGQITIPKRIRDELGLVTPGKIHLGRDSQDQYFLSKPDDQEIEFGQSESHPPKKGLK